jgi:O-6-methylguanine DNA methyltransferase
MPTSTRQAETLSSALFWTPWGEGLVYVRRGLLAGVVLPGGRAVMAAPAARVGADMPGMAAAPPGSAAPLDAAPAQAAAPPAAAALAHAALPPDAAPPAAAAPAQDREALAHGVSGLEAYFRGERLGWSENEVPLEGIATTPFRQAVYRALLAVPPGVTLSYGELAERAGYPRAARAVGTAMACNPVPVVIPCHRVILADGRLGDYGEDPAWKERLLRHERAYLGSAGLAGTAGGRHG